MKQKILCLTLILLGVYHSATAQQDRFRWRLGVYGGFTNYYGELEDRLFPPNPFLAKDRNTDFLTYGLSLENTFSRAWSWKATYTNGLFRANDVRRNWSNEIETNTPNFTRGFNAQTEVQDFSFLMTYYTDNGKLFGRKSFISPYFSFGAGVTNFEVFGDLKDAQGQSYYYWTDQTIRNAPEGTAGAVEIAQDEVFETNLSQENSDNYSTSTFNVQAGLGLKLRLGGRFNLNMEMMVKQTFSDNLDNFADPNDTWNDAYAFGSVSLHYNFAKKTQTFRAPKIYASVYPKDMPLAKKDSLGRIGDTLNTEEIETIERQETVLKEDSIVLYQNNQPIERIATNKVYQYDTTQYTHTPSIAKYQTEGSTVIQRDTTKLVSSDAIQKQYVVQEILYRPQTKDTLKIQRYIRDTIRIVKEQNPDYQPVRRLESTPEGSIYRYNPYKSAPTNYNAYQSPTENYQQYTPKENVQKSNYDYSVPNTSSTESRRTNVIAPVTGFGQNTASTPTDSTARSTEQRLDTVEEKLDLVAWHLLKMQRDEEKLKLQQENQLDTLGKAKIPSDSLQINPESDTLKTNEPTTEDNQPINSKEVAALNQQIRDLESKLNALNTQQKPTESTPPKTIGTLKITFLSGYYTLNATDKAKIKALVAGRTDAKYYYELQGFSDKSGDAQQNLILSKMRADAVRNALLELGVGMEQISSDFYGSSIESSTERKVEIKVIEK